MRSPRYAASPSVRGGGLITGFVNQNLGFPASGNVPGDCYIWGSAPESAAALKQSGLELIKVNVPHLVPSSQKLDLIYVSCGPSHFTAVTRSGNLYTWGTGENGRLGLGSLQHARIPTTIPELGNVESVSCGDSNSAAITANGALYTWGNGLTGQLGHGNFVTQYLPKRLICGGFSEIKIRRVSCGPFHTAAVSETGGIFTWGDGFGGKLGHGNEETLAMPKRLEGLTDVVRVSCGWWHTAAVAKVRNSNEDIEPTRLVLFTWGGHCTWNGDSNKGCLGNGAKTGEWLPVRAKGLETKNVKAVACGLNLTVALTKDGAVYQMGTTAAEDAHVPWEGATVPTRVEGPLKRINADQAQTL